MKVFYLIPHSEVGDVIKNINPTPDIELTKLNLLNTKLPPSKILDIYTNVDKINKVKDGISDNNLTSQKLDEQKTNDEKHTNENVDAIVKINDVISTKEEKNDADNSTDWYKTTSAVVNGLPLITRSNALDLVNTLITSKHISLKEYTVTYIKTGVTIELSSFLRCIFLVKTPIKGYEKFFRAIIQLIPNSYIRNDKLSKLKDNEDINISMGSGQKNLKPFTWILFK